MKNMKLGLKISIGFGLLIVITCLLGGLAVVNMRSVEAEAVRLAKEYMPEVDVATSVERNTLETMMDMRLYAATEDKKNFESGMRNLTELKNHLARAKTLAEKYPDLVKLRENAAKTQTDVTEYEKLLQETHKGIEGTEGIRQNMNLLASELVKVTDQYQNSQQETLFQEIAKGSTPDALKERAKKLDQATDIIQALTTIRIANLWGQVTRSPQYIEQSLKNFDELLKLVDSIRSMTREDANLHQLSAIREASLKYKQTMVDYIENFKMLQALATKRSDVATSVQTMAQESAKSGTNET